MDKGSVTRQGKLYGFWSIYRIDQVAIVKSCRIELFGSRTVLSACVTNCACVSNMCLLVFVRLYFLAYRYYNCT